MPTTEDLARDIARYDRWFAIECNNLAWELAENPAHTPAQRDEMLHTAHASYFHWKRIGTELNEIRAAMLLGQVHALLGNATAAMSHARRAFDYLATHGCPDWELAFAHAILAHAAHVSGDKALHAEHHAKAQAAGSAISNPEDKTPFARTFARIPAP